MNMKTGVAFYCRAKPQDADAFQIFKEAKRVFIGYPLWRDDVPYDPAALRACMVSPNCPADEWKQQLRKKKTRNYNTNRNLVTYVKEADDAIVAIPRPSEGAVYLTRIIGEFEVVDSPDWYDAYLRLRRDQGLSGDDDNCRHAGDIAQGWPVEEFTRISLLQVPGWLRRSMFGRRTFGYFKNHPLDSKTAAYDVFVRLLEGESIVDRKWTMDPDAVKQRLIDTMSPSAFEHLAVSLLQLEHPDEIWQHTGGPGDGGVDGLGSNAMGETAAILQAKLYAGDIPDPTELGPGGMAVRRYAAILVGPESGSAPDGVELLDINWFADRIIRYRKTLPEARMLRVGEG